MIGLKKDTIISRIFKNPLFAGSTLMMAGMMFTNFGSYLFHLLMGRMLGPIGYGELTSLISVAYLLSIFTATLSLTVVKFVTKYQAQNKIEYVFELFWQLTKRFLLISLMIISIFCLLQKQINIFLRLTNPLSILVLGFWLAISFVCFINEAILKGLLNFKFLTFSTIASTIIKLIAAVLFVKLGWMALGALGAILAAGVFSYLVSFWPLKFLWQYKKKQVKIPWQKILFYAGPVLATNLGMTSLYSTDIILVRHFFSPLESGLYSALAVLGKIVFFASGAIPVVMFPLISEKYEKGKKYRHILNQSFLIVTGISFSLIFIYFTVPKLVISLLYGQEYTRATSLLGIFAIFIGLYSLTNLLVNYFLSIGKVKLSLLPLAAAGLQILLIFLIHQNLRQIIVVSIFVSALLLTALLLYFVRDDKR